MIFSFWGVVGVRSAGGDLFFESEESRISFSSGDLKLVPPAEEYVKFAIGKKCVLGVYGLPGSRVVAERSEWVSEHPFGGGHLSYLFFTEKTEQKSYVGRTWSGDVIFKIPYFSAEKYFAPAAIALGNQDSWIVFDLAGAKIKEIPCSGLSNRLGRAHFTEDLFFFRGGKEAEYQIYDVKNRDIVSSVTVVGAVVCMLALPSGAILLVDAEGVKRFEYYGSQGVKLETLHRFASPLDVEESDALTWCDTERAYVAINRDPDNHILVALPLVGSGQVEELLWAEAWAITNQCGFLDGQNYLSLKRKNLLADNAVMLWSPTQPLTAELLYVDLSPHIQVSQVPSAAKGKHGYGIKIEDTSTNRAVRSAAYELGRLLSESCSGAYNHAEKILDRKFDGQFHIEITSLAEPDKFEQDFLPGYIEFFRYFGGLSPAGSKASLAKPAITWKVSFK